MPIVKTVENNIQVQFGTGDILIGSGMMGDYKEGLVSLIPQSPKPVGTYLKHEDPFVDMNSIPVSLIFGSVESLDVLIERLQKTRKYMTGELDIKSELDEDPHETHVEANKSLYYGEETE